MGAGMIRSRGRWVGGVGGFILALNVAGTAAAYWTQTPATVTIFGPHGNIKCGQWVTFRAVIRDHEGDRIANGGPVTWSFDSPPSASDQIDPVVTTTNSHGRATTSVFFACEPGDRVLRATADSVSGTIHVTVHVKDQFEDQRVSSAVGGVASGRSGDTSATSAKKGAIARASGVLPNTSTEPTSTPTLVALLALLVGISLVVRRTTTLRR
jgi:LPXTG-motif cell wall-anchored protein